MPARLKRQELEGLASAVSESLRGLELHVSCRNGNTALDLCRDSAYPTNPAYLSDVLVVGTAREVSLYLRGMREMSLLASDGRDS